MQRIVAAAGHSDHVVIDLARVSSIDDCARHLLCELGLMLTASGRALVVASAQHHPRLLRALEEQQVSRQGEGLLRCAPDLDRAFEWCEDRLLSAHGAAPVATRSVALADHDVCRGLEPDDLAHLERLLERRSFHAGAIIIRQGEAADAVFLLARGEVSVTVDLPGGRVRRLATLSPGMSFGELAVVHRGSRTADVRADTGVECWMLTTTAFEVLGRARPQIKIVILENLLRRAAQMLARANEEVATLAS